MAVDVVLVFVVEVVGIALDTLNPKGLLNDITVKRVSTV